MRSFRDDAGQLQLIEAITVTVFIFIAISIVASFRLPTNPQTFQEAELKEISTGLLRAREAAPPGSSDDCNESPCPFMTQLERMFSLAMGYRGPAVAAGESPDAAEFEQYFEEALPAGSQFLLRYWNGYNNTRLAASAATPPLQNVIVARLLVGPNWTVHANNLNLSAVVRVGELTGWGTPTISDPLNRTSSEWGHSWTTLFSSRVPNNATYGTYQACPGGSCRYYTVVPPGVVGAGAQILGDERDTASGLATAGSWTNVLAYEDKSPVGLSPGDPFYFDINANRFVGAGDVRLSGVPSCRGTVTCEPGSYVRTGDADIGRVLLGIPATPKLGLRSTDATTSEGEGVYLDVDNGGTVNADDVRLTRVGLYRMGTRVVAGDTDLGGSIAQQFLAGEIVWSDSDSDLALDEGEALYLNLSGLGQTVNLDRYDVHLTPVGEPTRRYPYDLQLAVWYGV